MPPVKEVTFKWDDKQVECLLNVISHFKVRKETQGESTGETVMSKYEMITEDFHVLVHLPDRLVVVGPMCRLS